MVLWHRMVAFAVLAAMLFGLTGCSVVKVERPETTEEKQEVTYANTYNGYKDYQIGTYERLRAMDLLEAYGLTDYSMDGRKRHYPYTVEEFRAVTELDETYLYALYILCDRDTFMVVLEALGYEDLEDFLIRMNYVDDEGEPSLFVWAVADMELISEIMVEKSQK